MNDLKSAIKEFLEENYDTSKADTEEASSAMYIYVVEHYIPDVIGMFDIERE